MKKRILTWLLAVSMLGSLLTVPAGAAAVTKFSDVSDSYTAPAAVHGVNCHLAELRPVQNGVRAEGTVAVAVQHTHEPQSFHGGGRWQFTPWTAAASWDGIPPLPSSRT